MRDGRHNIAAGLAISLLLAACATTGNPRSGGYFGWSKAKADADVANLQQASNAARQEQLQEQQKSKELQQHQGQLAGDASDLRAQLDQLLHKNTELQQQLSDLLQRNQLKTGQIARLQKTLAQNRQLRQRLESSGSSVSRADTDAVDKQNEELVEDILSLTGGTPR